MRSSRSFSRIRLDVNSTFGGRPARRVNNSFAPNQIALNYRLERIRIEDNATEANAGAGYRIALSQAWPKRARLWR